jgi:hypothetical protein
MEGISIDSVCSSLPEKFREKPQTVVEIISKPIQPHPAKARTVSKPKTNPVRVDPPKKDNRTIPDGFLDITPGGLWTGTKCGCTKPKEQFYEPYSCRKCRNESRRHVYAGHYLHLIRIMGIRFYSPAEGEKTKGLLAALRNEANSLKVRCGQSFQVVIVGKRVRVRRVK